MSGDQDFNVALGKRLSSLRQKRNMSQEYLGAMLGVRYQQIHKYETGENKMPPSRIGICANVFQVPVGYFFGEDNSNAFLQSAEIANLALELKQLPENIREGLLITIKQINASLYQEKYSKNNILK